MHDSCSSSAKAAFRKQYLKHPPSETYIFEDLLPESQALILKTFEVHLDKEDPIMAYFPNKGYFFLITTKRFCVWDRNRVKSILLSKILEEDWYYPFEQPEEVGERIHHVSKFCINYKYCLLWRRKLLLKIEHIGHFGMAEVFVILYRNGLLATQPRRQ